MTRPGIVGRLAGWALAAHAFPLVMVVSLTALIGLASADGDLDPGRLFRVVAAMLTSQLAIGWTNDYRDREHDRVYQPSKPVPAGLVPAAWLPWAAMLAVGVSLATGATLGPLPLALLTVGTAAGLAYDLGIKDTRLSWLPFVVAFAVLPPFVWSALDIFRAELLWLYVVGWPLAVASHVANVLPDLDSDAAAGRSSVAVVLGRARSLVLLGACLAATPLFVLVSLPFVRYEAAVLGATLAGYGTLAGAAAFAYRRASGRGAAVAGFRCVVIAAVGFATGWLLAV